MAVFQQLDRTILPSSRRALPDFFPTMVVSGGGRLSSIETNRGRSRECAGGDCSGPVALQIVRDSRVERDKVSKTRI